MFLGADGRLVGVCTLGRLVGRSTLGRLVGRSTVGRVVGRSADGRVVGRSVDGRVVGRSPKVLDGASADTRSGLLVVGVVRVSFGFVRGDVLSGALPTPPFLGP